jgi:hypothetical protein
MIENIKFALVNSISYNEALRKQALDFLTNQCEPIPEFQITLLQIIAREHAVTGASIEEA